MADYIYIDDSNLYIEGRRVSAVRKRLAPDIITAMKEHITDYDYTIDFGQLHDFLTSGDPSKIKRVVLFGSTPPAKDSIWEVAKRVGFEIKLEDRTFANKEKKIDTGIATMMARDAYKFGNAAEDTFVLVAGDRDYVPIVSTLKGDGYSVEVVFWNHAARELKALAFRFISLDEHLELLRLQ